MQRTPSSSRTLKRTTLAAGLSLSALMLGCGQGTAPSSVAKAGVGSNPAIADGFDKFLFEGNFGGGASDLTIQAVYFGRLVDIYDCKSCGTPAEKRTPLFRDLLVDAEIQSDGSTYELETNPVTARQEMTILRAYDPTPGSAFMNALAALEAGLDTVKPKGVSVNELPPFSMVPRNGAVAIRFDDLLDPGSVDSQTVKVRVGYPPEATFESRVLPDRNHGDFAGGAFRSTRVLIDFSVTKEESIESGVPENLVGLPSAVNTTQPNVGVVIPTTVNASAAQFSRLQNLSGQPVAFTGNGPNQPGSPTLDVVRGFRAGGRGNVTGDEYDGFLPDDTAPELYGSQSVTINNVSVLGGGEFSFDMTFAAASCALAPRVGDLVDLATADLRVIADGPPPTGATVSGVLAKRIDDLSPNAPPFGVGQAEYKFPWDATLGLPPACFVRFNPSGASGPGVDVDPTASVRISFSEPMNPTTVDSFEAFTIKDPTQTAGSLSELVVGTLIGADDQTTFTFLPSLPFNHTQGTPETYNIDLISGLNTQTQTSFGLTDLAGNRIEELPGQIPFTLDPAANSGETGGISLRFDSVDEDGNGSPEIRGQLVYDLARGVVQPRGVTRFDAYMDTTALSAPTVQAMTPIPFGVIEPLSIFGSRTMTVWRYHDLGLPFFDDAFFNLDVEGLYWMLDPLQTGVKIDFFPEFQLLMSHSKYLPDELYAPPPMGMTPVIRYPTSGLNQTFADNLLDPVADPQTVLAPKDDGYLINPNDAFTPPLHTGVFMVPLPFNPPGTPMSEFKHWTWRDTTILAQAGPFGEGADTGGNPDTTDDGYYGPGEVPTIGLPMLLDFRTYPAQTAANGTNALAIAGVNFNVGLLPFFRIHSTGGIDSSGTNQVLIDPDTETFAQGGLDGAGNPTQGIDAGFYYGGAAFVTRVNRIHTIWLDTGSASNFGPLVSSPSFNQVPAGTQMSFAFRGTTSVSPIPAAQNGNNIDPYGDSFQTTAGGTPFSATFLGGDATWKSTLDQVNGARFVQVRVTMIANDLTGVVPELSALGIPFFK